jgi:hypothetical protein
MLFFLVGRLGIPFKTVSLDFSDEDAAAVWVIRNQFGRRNLTLFARSELALKLEPLIAAKAKENQKQSSGRGQKGCQISDNLIDTKKEVAKAAGVSHDTIAKTKLILEHADEVATERARKERSKRRRHLLIEAAVAVRIRPLRCRRQQHDRRGRDRRLALLDYAAINQAGRGGAKMYETPFFPDRSQNRAFFA